MSRAAQSNAVQLHWADRAPPPPRCPRDFFPDETHGAPHASLHATLFDADNADVLTWLAQPSQRDALWREGGLRCVYIDPPYAMQTAHGVRTRAGDALAYDDRWELPRYLAFMHERMVLIRDLLESDGVLFVHCDWRANACLRILLDEVFGAECFRNEIIWRRAPNLGRQARALQLGRTADSILVYSRTPRSRFRGVTPCLTTPVRLTRSGAPAGARWDEARKQWYTLAPRGDYTDASIARLKREGRVHTTSTGTHAVKYFLRTLPDGTIVKDAPADTIWDDPEVAPLRHATRAELDIGYTTQKPESLLTRILRWATREGDLVADFFAGAGTTLACAHKLGRRWLGCDNSALAIHTVRKRMLALRAPLRILRCERRQASICRARIARRAPCARIEIEYTRQWAPAGALTPSRRTPRITRRKHSSTATRSTPDLLMVGAPGPHGEFVCASFAPIADNGTADLNAEQCRSTAHATHVRVVDPLGGVAEGPLVVEMKEPNTISQEVSNAIEQTALGQAPTRLNRRA